MDKKGVLQWSFWPSVDKKGVLDVVLRGPLVDQKRCSPWSFVALRGQKRCSFVVLRGPPWTKKVFLVVLRGPSWTKKVFSCVPAAQFVRKKVFSSGPSWPSVDKKGFPHAPSRIDQITTLQISVQTFRHTSPSTTPAIPPRTLAIARHTLVRAPMTSRRPSPIPKIPQKSCKSCFRQQKLPTLAMPASVV